MQYLIYRNNQQEGPFTAEAIRLRLTRGELTPTDLCFSDGMTEWTSLSAVPELVTAPGPVPEQPPSLAGAQPRFWNTFVERMGVTAQLTQKQAHRKKLELSDLRHADYQNGKKAHQLGIPPAACAGLVAQIDAVRQQAIGLESEKAGPADTFGQKAKETAAAAARAAKIQALHAREGLLLTELGGKIRLLPSDPALTAEIAAARAVTETIAALDAEITALSSRTYSWARQPLWALVAILLIAAGAVGYHLLHHTQPAVVVYAATVPVIATDGVPPSAAAPRFVYPPGHTWIADETTDRAVEHSEPGPPSLDQVKRYTDAAAKLTAEHDAEMQKQSQEQMQQYQAQVAARKAQDDAARQQQIAAEHNSAEHPFDIGVDQQKTEVAAEMRQLAANPPPASAAAMTSAAPAAQNVPILAQPLGPADPNDEHQDYVGKRLAMSPDKKRCFILADAGSGQCAYIDGAPGAAYSKIVFPGNTPVFSVDSQSVGFVAQKPDGHYVVVIDGKEQSEHDAIFDFIWAPKGHRYAYFVRDKTDNVVVDGQAMPETVVTEPGAGGVGTTGVGLFSPDGNHFAYEAKQTRVRPGMEKFSGWIKYEGVYTVIIGGKPDPAVEGGSGVQHLSFSDDSQHIVYFPSDFFEDPGYAIVDSKRVPLQKRVSEWAFKNGHLATIGGKNSVSSPSLYLDGKQVGSSEASMSGLVLNSDGSRVACVGRAVDPLNSAMLQKPIVYDNGQPGQQYDVCDKLQFSPDGSKLVYEALSNQRTTVVCNGKELATFDTVSPTVISPDSKHVAFLGAKDQQVSLVVDGTSVGPLADASRNGPVVFLPDGQHLTYPGYRRGTHVYDLTGGPNQDGIQPGDVVMSGDGKHTLRLWEPDSGPQVLTLDGKTVPTSATDLGNIALNQDGTHYAFVGNLEGDRVFLDGRPGPVWGRISPVQFSPDGGTVAYVAAGGNNQNVHVVIGDSSAPAADDILRDGDNYVMKFLGDGTLEYWPMMKKALYRCTISAASIRGLPQATGQDRVKQGWNLISKGSWDRMVMTKDGWIYAVTIEEGAHRLGSLFRIKHDGSAFSVLHDFADSRQDGHYPAKLFLSPSGLIYGTTEAGGPSDAGDLFSVDPQNGTYTSLWSNPGGLIEGIWTFDKDQNPLYITAVAKQFVQDGQLVHVHPDGTSTIETIPVHIGRNPPFVDGGFGALYVGTQNHLYRLAKDGKTAMELHTFRSGPTDGDGVSSLATGDDGTLYGTTPRGGKNDSGVVFRINRDGSDFKILYSDQGAAPQSPIWGDGRLWVMTEHGLTGFTPSGDMTVVSPQTAPMKAFYDHEFYAGSIDDLTHFVFSGSNSIQPEPIFTFQAAPVHSHSP